LQAQLTLKPFGLNGKSIRPLRKVAQETGSDLAAKISALTGPSFYALLSFACLNLIAVGDFVCQAGYIFMQICNF